MKKIYILIINIFIISICFLTFNKQEIKAFSDDNSNRNINVVVSEEDSMSCDRILRYALNNLGYSVSVTSAKMTTAIMGANAGTYDILAIQNLDFDGQYTNLKIVNESLQQVTFTYFTLKENTNVPSSLNWSDFLNYRCGGEIQRPYVELNVGNADYKTYSSKPKLMEALKNEEIDIAIIPIVSNANFYFEDVIEKRGTIETKDVYSYVNIKNNHLIPLLEEEYRKIRASGNLEKIMDGSFFEKDDQFVILNIMSYDPTLETVKIFQESLRTNLSSNENIRIYTMYLNSNLSTDLDVRNKMNIDTLRSDFAYRLPDVVVSSNSYALNFIKQYYHIIFESVPIIHTGPGDIEVSGFNEFLYLRQNIAVEEVVDQAIKLFPQTTEFFIINDYSLDGKIWADEIDQKIIKYKDQYTITYNKNGTVDELIDELNHLSSNTVILSGIYTGTSSNRFLLGEQLRTFITKNYNNPALSWNLAGLETSEIGGKYIDQEKIAKYIAQAILDHDIIHEKVKVIDSEEFNTWIFNENLLNKYNIKKSSLPSNSTIINQKLSMREANPIAYKMVILIIIVLSLGIAVFIYFFIVTRLKNRKLIEVQKSLVDAEELILKEREINVVKQKFNSILKDAPISFVITDNTGVIIQLNDHSVEKLGFEVGKLYSNFDSDYFMRLSQLEILKTTGYISDILVDYTTTSGKVECYLVSVKKFEFDNEVNYVLWGINFEEINKQRKALIQAQNDLKQIINLLPWPICVLDPITKKNVYLNQVFDNKFRNESMYLHENPIFPQYQSNGELTKDMVDQYIYDICCSEEAVIKEIEHFIKDRTVTMRCYGTKVYYDEKESVLVILEDIEAQKVQQNMLINAALKEKEANQLKSKFIMNMSHEIRTPMNAIIGITDVQLMKENPAEIQESFKKVNISAKLLLNIINDILDFSKIEADRLELVEVEFNLEDILSNALLTASQKLATKRVEMLLNLDTNLPRRLIGDETRLWQIIKNILDNSAKFTDKGHVVLKVSTIEANGIEERKILFEISDTGKGMSKEELDRLYLPFEQFGSKVSKANGTGLGMSITKSLVQLMNGTIEVESEVGRGTKTSIIIPFKEITLEKIINFDEVKTLKNKNILIIDDDEIATSIMDVLLSNSGANTTILNRASQVINRVKEEFSNNKIYDLILIDYMLDEGNGVDLAIELNKYISENTKLLMVSQYVKLISNIDLTLFKDVIDKPFVPTQFLNSINRALSINKVIIPENKKKYHFPNANVLVFEDNVINQEVITDILKYFKINVMIAENGLIGLEMLNNKKYDLVFMDILMPVMDGHEATKKIRKENIINNNIPIVAMTANTMKSEMDLCMNEGMNGFISKPINIDKLYEILMKFLPFELNKNALNEEENIIDQDLLSLKELGIEIVSGVNRFGNKADLYKKSLLKFAQRMNDEIKNGDYIFDSSKQKELLTYVHSLKGVTGNLSIIDIHEKLVNYEKKVRENNYNLNEYEFIMENIRKLCSAIIEIFKIEDIIKDTGSEDEIVSHLNKLLDDLKKAYAKDIDLDIELIKSKTWNKINDAVLNIVKEVENYDYDKAIDLIKNLLDNEK